MEMVFFRQIKFIIFCRQLPLIGKKCKQTAEFFVTEMCFSVKSNCYYYFFAGRQMELSQSLFVVREDPDSRQKVKEKIVERTKPNQGWPQLLIFPEGSTSNR